MGYCTQNDITALISIKDLLAMLDDIGAMSLNDGNVQGVLNSLITLQSNLIDGSIANAWDVPIVPTPPLLNAACTVFCVEALYQRRLTPDEKNPYKAQADIFRKRLQDIGNGKLEFDLRNPRDYPQGTAVTVPIAINTNTL